MAGRAGETPNEGRKTKWGTGRKVGKNQTNHARRSWEQNEPNGNANQRANDAAGRREGRYANAGQKAQDKALKNHKDGTDKSSDCGVSKREAGTERVVSSEKRPRRQKQLSQETTATN